MNCEILILKKDDLIEELEQFSQKIASKISTWKHSNGNNVDNVRVKRLNTRQIKEMLGVSDTTFDKIQDELPLHRSKTGRLFGYEHDIIIHMFREHPPYFDYTRFYEYISEKTFLNI